MASPWTISYHLQCVQVLGGSPIDTDLVQMTKKRTRTNKSLYKHSMTARSDTTYRFQPRGYQHATGAQKKCNFRRLQIPWSSLFFRFSYPRCLYPPPIVLRFVSCFWKPCFIGVFSANCQLAFAPSRLFITCGALCTKHLQLLH
jgi:hypothetical protein